MAGRVAKLTFVDAGVLIAAARGGNVQATRAMEILDDPEREFAASPFLRLEVLPQAVFAAAASVGASELITTERPSHSIHRARAVRIVTIHPER